MSKNYNAFWKDYHNTLMANDGPTGPYTPAYKFGIIDNFSPSEETVHEDLGPANDNEVIRLCRTPDQISIYFLYDREAKTITGAIEPAATGVFSLAGVHNGKDYYQRTDEGWFIWWDGVDTWNISIELGVQGDAFWTRTKPVINGDYIPGGTAEGTPTVEPPDF